MEAVALALNNIQKDIHQLVAIAGIALILILGLALILVIYQWTKGG